jgi:hypothetical protein
MEENASEARSDEPRVATPIEDDGAIPQDERTATMVFAVVLMMFGLFWVYASSDLPSRQQTAYLSQGFLPITAGFLLAGLSLLLLIGTWMTKSRPAAELGRPPLFELEAEARAAGIFLALLATSCCCRTSIICSAHSFSCWSGLSSPANRCVHGCSRWRP